MRMRSSGAIALLMVSLAGSAAAVDYTWDGGAGNDNWSDPLNWVGDSGFPSGSVDNATIPNGFGPSLTNVPTSLQRLFTGDTLVTVNNAGTMSFTGTSAGPRGGTGGLTFTAGIVFINGSAVLSAAGDFTAPSISWGNSGSITQTGGLLYIDTFNMPILGNPVSILAWQFGAGKPLAVSAGGTPSGNYTVSAAPVFLAGHRPTWNLTSGYSTGVNGVWDLAGFVMTGAAVNVTAGGSPLNRYATFRNSVAGGQVDANALSIGSTSYAAPYLDFVQPVTVTLRGSGTNYSNFSVNNDGTSKTVSTLLTSWPRPFKIDTSTFIFDPTGGTCHVDTGSKDRDSALLDPADWVDNFAFGQVVIGSGDTVTLVGNANVEGGGTNALYATQLTGLGSGATLKLNGHNAYLLKRPDNLTFDFTGGGRVYFPKAGTVITLE